MEKLDKETEPRWNEREEGEKEGYRFLKMSHTSYTCLTRCRRATMTRVEVSSGDSKDEDDGQDSGGDETGMALALATGARRQWG